jgi:hypothetical protein
MPSGGEYVNGVGSRGAANRAVVLRTCAVACRPGLDGGGDDGGLNGGVEIEAYSRQA